MPNQNVHTPAGARQHTLRAPQRPVPEPHTMETL